jgi:integrase
MGSQRVTLPAMTDTATRRRGHGEDAIYFDAAKNRYVGAISLGFGPDGKRTRRKVTGRTKQEVRDKLKALHAELDRGLHTSATYTVRQAVDDWLEGGLPGWSERTRSIYQEALTPLLERVGAKPLRELAARDVRAGLEALSGDLSTRYLQIARASLARAIRYAEAHHLVGRNVATLVDPPKGQVGRPSRSLTLDQSLALLKAARESRLNAYVVLSLTVGIRTEEARELRWDHVDLDGDPSAARPIPPSVAVWRSVRQGGDTKTAKSRRTLALPQTAVQALREHRKRQAEDRLAAGALWQDHGLVFASAIGTPLDAANVRREFRKITEAARLGTRWAPRDLRHTFVSLMSADGVPIEEIARLAGHNRTATTELVYRHELRPVITKGAEVMDRILNANDRH